MASKCGQTHTESGNQTDVPKNKGGGGSHPLDARRRGELRDLCAQDLDLDHVKHRAVGERRRWRVTERGGADGSAIWWMEEKLGR